MDRLPPSQEAQKTIGQLARENEFTRFEKFKRWISKYKFQLGAAVVGVIITYVSSFVENLYATRKIGQKISRKTDDLARSVHKTMQSFVETYNFRKKKKEKAEKAKAEKAEAEKAAKAAKAEKEKAEKAEKAAAAAAAKAAKAEKAEKAEKEKAEKAEKEKAAKADDELDFLKIKNFMQEKKILDYVKKEQKLQEQLLQQHQSYESIKKQYDFQHVLLAQMIKDKINEPAILQKQQDITQQLETKLRAHENYEDTPQLKQSQQSLTRIHNQVQKMIQKNPNPYWLLEKIPLASLAATLAVVFPGPLFLAGKTIAFFVMKSLYYIFHYGVYYGVYYGAYGAYYGLKGIASTTYFLASNIIFAIITTLVLAVLYLVRRKK